MIPVNRQQLREIVSEQTPGQFIHVIAPMSAVGTGVSFEISSADPKRAMIVPEYMTGFEYLIGLLKKGKRAYAVTYEDTKFRAEFPFDLLTRTLVLHLEA
jgi:hypothetical protein